MELINLTPHTINIHTQAGVVSVPASGTVARVATSREPLETLANGIQLYHTRYGEVEGLPEPQEGTGYIVSALVRQAVPMRLDVFSPGSLIRDGQGQPMGCEGLDANF